MEILIVVLISAAAVAAVLHPIVSTRARPAARKRPSSAAGTSAGGSTLEGDVARYRDALRAGTACGRCGLANPPDSRFCAECGRRLDAKPRAAHAS